MTDPLVIFTPSGKRGRFPAGTTVLAAARLLGVDLDSVCGGRGICSKCQVEPAFGDFPKHGLTVTEDALSPWNAVEDRYDRIRGLAPGRRLGCQAQLLADAVIDVPPESQVHKQVVRKRAEARPIVMDPATRLYYVEVAEPDMHEPSGDLQRLERALAEQWGIENAKGDLRTLQMLQPALRKGDWKVTCAVHRDGARGPHPAGLARLLRRRDLRPRHRRRLDHHRRPPLRPRDRRGPRLHRPDEPADPLRRGPDEPGLLRHAEPRRRRRDDPRRPRRPQRTWSPRSPPRPASTPS